MPLRVPTRSQIRNRIVLRMLGRNIPLTDLTLISVLRILLEEMVIEEFSRLYTGLKIDHEQWFTSTATGENLDRRIADFGLTRLPPRAATGWVRVSNDDGAAFTVTPGTIYRTAPDASGAMKRYQVQPNPDNLPSGEWVADSDQVALVKVQALTPGPEGNTAANTIVAAENVADPAQALITNPLPLVDGRGAESDEEFRDRFWGYLGGLTRGTRASIRYHLLSHTDATGVRPVKSVAIVEWDGTTLLTSEAGTPVALKIYIEDGTGTASSELVNEIQALVDGNDTDASPGLRAAGMPTEVLAASPLPVTVHARVVAHSGSSPAEVKRRVDEAIRAYIGQLPVAGQTIQGQLQGQVIRAELFRRIMNVDGVLEVDLDEPSGNLPVPIGRKAMPATVTVTVGTI